MTAGGPSSEGPAKWFGAWAAHDPGGCSEAVRGRPLSVPAVRVRDPTVGRWPVAEIAPARVKGNLAFQAIAATVNSRA